MIKLIFVHPEKTYLEKAQRHFSLLSQFASPLIATTLEEVRKLTYLGTVPGMIVLDESLLSEKLNEKIKAIKALYPNITFHILTGPLGRHKMIHYIQNDITGFSDSASPFSVLAEDFKTHFEKGAYIDGKLFGNIIHDILIEKSGKQILPEVSEKESTIVTLLSNGYKYKEIESLTGLRLDTIRYYVKNIYKKFDVKSKAELSSVVHSQARF
jgi:DNA-binding NarL/FixJ family response regulator